MSGVSLVAAGQGWCLVLVSVICDVHVGGARAGFPLFAACMIVKLNVYAEPRNTDIECDKKILIMFR